MGVGGYFAYNKYFYQSDAYKAYLKFEEALHKGNCPDMYALVDGAAKTYVDTLCASQSITVYGQTAQLPSAASQISDMSAMPGGGKLHREIETETLSDDGNQDSLEILLTLTFRPSNFRDTTPEKRKEKLKMQKFGEAWKIIEYAQESVK